MVMPQDDSLLINHILSTGESKFTNNRILNQQNNHYWSDENLHWTVPTKLSNVLGNRHLNWLEITGGTTSTTEL